MKKIFNLIIVVYLFFISSVLLSQPKSDFNTSYINAEKNPQLRINAENLAISKGLPYNIYIPNKAFIEAIAVENNEVVYSIITNFHNPFNGSYCAFYNEINSTFDFSKGRITYGNSTIDNTGEHLIISPRKTTNKLLLIPCFTTSRRCVFAFDSNTGDVVDTAFIPYSSPMLQTPRRAIQLSRTKVLVADQVSDVVQLFDTSGAYIQVFAPAGGLNNAILDNIRDLEFRDNGNLLVTNAGNVGNAYNTIQQFDHSGNYLNVFASDSINSPYNLLFRNNVLYLGNSSGINNICKYNKNSGAYLGNLVANSINFPQQIINLPDGNIGVCEFSGALTGLRYYDSSGTFIITLDSVKGIRAAWKLGNGHFIMTNSVGVYEVNDTTGFPVRNLVTGYNFTCIAEFDPMLPIGINEEINTTPKEFKLYDNFPNPFNPATTIKFSVPRRENIKITVYDALGKEVKTLMNEIKNTGTYEINFNANGLSSGVYFYKIEAGNFTDTKRMVLLK